MKRFASLLLIALASTASATGITGSVSTNAGPLWPCDIDVFNRATNTIVLGIADSTLPNGNYNLVLPNGRYDLFFKPKVGQHIFKGEQLDQRVNNNTLSVFVFLPSGGVYVSGHVQGTDNAAVANVNIKFLDAVGNTPTNIQDSATDLAGNFNALVDPGNWHLEVIPALLSHRVPLSIPGPFVSDIALGSIVVQTGSITTCTVTDPTLFPIAGAKLTVRTVPGRDKVFVPANNTTASGVVQAVLPIGSTFDFIAEPPAGLITTYATLTQYNVVVGAADVTLPNFALPVGRALTGHVIDGGTGLNLFNVDIDVDKWLPSAYPRIETPNDFTNAFGNFLVTVASGNYRITLNPPVVTKCLPVRINNFVVGAGPLNLGNIPCPKGHWLDVNVVEQGTGLPLAGVNLDLENLDTGLKLITVGDVTDATGFARLVCDNAYYKLKGIPTSATHDTAWTIGGMRTLTDTSLTLVMPRKGILGVGGSRVSTLRMASPWPNPSRAGMNFAFAGQGRGRLDIVDVTGRLVATPWQGELAGEQTARWTGSDAQGRPVPDGIYFARLHAGPEDSVRRIVITH